MEVVAMFRSVVLKLVKILAMSTPFVSLILMLSALWGVVGKTTYADITPIHHTKNEKTSEAKNYLVNETINQELCSGSVKKAEDNIIENDTETDAKQPSHDKLDWEHIV
jgi:hypothetical protein